MVTMGNESTESNLSFDSINIKLSVSLCFSYLANSNHSKWKWREPVRSYHHDVLFSHVISQQLLGYSVTIIEN